MAEDPSPAGVDEFEREPVPRRALLGFKSFVGMYAGEHCAGTELMLGPLFVAAGVSAFDLIVGLVVGNLLAVLSWTLLTAPIATRTRLTLYYQLEKICGRNLVTLYNLANGVMFCFLAGAMITVSATAVGVAVENIGLTWNGNPVQIPMPELNDDYPNSVAWVVAVFAMGVMVTVVAAYGYNFVARVANIAAPWMVLVFLAFGVVALRQFIDATDTRINSPADLWRLAETHIWKGGEPLPGRVKFTFWHVTFFAWFCNMAMHVGMSDLTIFRYARHSWYGVATASGMYVGHFMAWMSAAMLFAYQLHETHPDEYLVNLLITDSAQYAEADRDSLLTGPLTPELIREGMRIENQLVESGQLMEDDKRIGPPTPLPGPLAYGACGIAGLLCVIVAGWTTANPTIYRAGLAFQAIMPRVSRVKVTLATGLLATIAGAFPAIAMKLLEFVALYGMVLMPMGAVVLVDFYFLRRLGLASNYAEQSGTRFNWAAGLTWFLTLAACVVLVKYTAVQAFLADQGINILPADFDGIQIYFVSLPGWFFAAVLYIVLSKLYQRKTSQ